jgi:pimeloyl-ACP methyl ester carboxylesterase
MKNILALAAYRKFFPWFFPQLRGFGISGQLFLSDRRELLVRHMIEQLVIC